MDKIRLALVLITLAITLGPTLGIVLAYQGNLLELIVPPELNQIMDSMISTAVPGNGTPIEPVGPPDVQYDPNSLTATITFQMKSPFPIDVTIDSLSGPIECDEHRYPLGTATLKNPVSMSAGKTATVTVVATFTQDGIDHIKSDHAGQEAVKVSLASATMKAGEMTVQITEPMSIGEVPLT
jgi:hypothetical protein